MKLFYYPYDFLFHSEQEISLKGKDKLHEIISFYSQNEMDTHLFKHMMDLAENEYHQKKNLLNATYDKTDPKSKSCFKKGSK